MKIFFIAGEPSGDLLGGRLIAALKEQTSGSLSICGVGGSRMIEQGLTSLFPMTDLTLFGLAELLPKLPLILRRLKETEAAIRRERPDLVVTIDAPDFSFRIAKKFVGSGIKFVHYVAPTVWAWRPGRAKKIQPLYQHLLALFPFEPKYFEAVGLPCTFVGHPLVEAEIEQANGQRFRAAYGLDEGAQLLVVLPGSRRSELNSLIPVFSDVIKNLHHENPKLRIVIPTLPHLAERLRHETANWAIEPIFTTTDRDKYDALTAGTAALAASGTVALELALAGLPAVIAYKIHPLTYLLYRRLIKTKYANLVNIIADRLIVPEFLQHNCTADKLTAAVSELLTQSVVRDKQRVDLSYTHNALKPDSGLSPSQQAAKCLLDLVNS